MTQQGDPTSQEPVPTQDGPGSAVPQSSPEPAAPSPYLAEGQAVPEAYSAPPQPGKPRYGTTAARFQPTGSLGPRGFGQAADQAAYGQPRTSGQRQFGQPPGGQPGNRPVPGAAGWSQRDATLAGAFERLLAMTLDWALILGVAFAVLHTPMLRFWHQVQAVLTSARTLSQTAAQNAYINFVQSPTTVSTVVHFMLLTFGIALPYFWVMSLLGGATLGQRALGLRVVMAADRSGIDIRTAGIRAAVFLAGPALFSFGAEVGTLISTVGGVLWLADCMILITDSRRQSLHDRAAGTIVVRKSALAQPNRRL
jgi:uncharacterized RDD family membrane protein YckC